MNTDTMYVKGIIERVEEKKTKNDKPFKVIQVKTTDKKGYAGFIFVRAIGEGAKTNFQVGKPLDLEIKQAIEIDYANKRCFVNNLYFGAN